MTQQYDNTNRSNLRRLGGCKPMPPIKRFHASYIEDPETGCWNWLGKSRSGRSRGYGRIKIDGKGVMAHRYSWELHNGRSIPEGMVVMHKCDNPGCVNPAHLSVGTHSDNNYDMYQKGRHKGGRGLRGSGNGNAKIGPKQAEEIFSDQRPQRQIARDYGITQATVSQIKTKKTWSHVNV
jgi:hypothetical protein